MTANPFNIGRNVRAVVVWNGIQVDLPSVTEFRSQQDVTPLKSAPLNDVPRTVNVPNGWSGQITFQRDKDTLDKLLASDEAAFWSAGTMTSGSIFQYITEVDGSKSTYEYTNCSLHLSSAGDWQKENIVMQTLAFTASQRVKIS